MACTGTIASMNVNITCHKYEIRLIIPIRMKIRETNLEE